MGFNHLPWDYKMRSGKNLMVGASGTIILPGAAAKLRPCQNQWLALKDKIDPSI